MKIKLSILFTVIIFFVFFIFNKEKIDLNGVNFFLNNFKKIEKNKDNIFLDSYVSKLATSVNQLKEKESFLEILYYLRTFFIKNGGYPLLNKENGENDLYCFEFYTASTFLKKNTQGVLVEMLSGSELYNELLSKGKVDLMGVENGVCPAGQAKSVCIDSITDINDLKELNKFFNKENKNEYEIENIKKAYSEFFLTSFSFYKQNNSAIKKKCIDGKGFYYEKK